MSANFTCVRSAPPNNPSLSWWTIRILAGLGHDRLLRGRPVNTRGMGAKIRSKFSFQFKASRPADDPILVTGGIALPL